MSGERQFHSLVSSHKQGSNGMTSTWPATDCTHEYTTKEKSNNKLRKRQGDQQDEGNDKLEITGDF